jgi:KipI family sensor histidine kinase inhibitor
VTVGRPQVVPFGDSALLATTSDVGSAHALAALIDERRPDTADLAPGTGRVPRPVDEVVVGFASVLVVLGPDAGPTDLDAYADWLGRLIGESDGGGPARAAAVTHELPVAFDGADLTDVAAWSGVTVRRLVELVVTAELEVAFVGFAPGFPYLTGLPDELAALPRRATPRPSVPAGSVAVAGGFASVYPRSTPGGWHLLGRTSEVLFDPDRPPHARMTPGDRVRFVVADGDTSSSVATADGWPRPLIRTDAREWVDVLEPGVFDLVQDAGRSGTARMGVPRGGAADPRSLALVNLLLGNDRDAAAIESVVTGPSLRFTGDGHLAALGSGPGAVELRIDGRPVPDAAVVPVRDGQVVTVGPIRRGLRAYLGVAGGFATPRLFGSQSSDTLSGLGPGALRSGDRLARGRPGRLRGRLLSPGTGGLSGPVGLRVLPGPHALAADGSAGATFDRMVATRWRVGADSNRIGIRLEPVDPGRPIGGAPVTSTPMVTGAVQLPPDGRPIVLLPDHATVGGYPVVACVITADLPRLGQLAAGDTVRFVPVDGVTAAGALARARAEPASAVSGWYPTAAGT